jgi:hypothetical protein
MIGPRASARADAPAPRELALRARAAMGEKISSFDMLITWVTPAASASCVTAL